MRVLRATQRSFHSRSTRAVETDPHARKPFHGDGYRLRLVSDNKTEYPVFEIYRRGRRPRHPVACPTGHARCDATSSCDRRPGPKSIADAVRAHNALSVVARQDFVAQQHPVHESKFCWWRSNVRMLLIRFSEVGPSRSRRRKMFFPFAGQNSLSARPRVSRRSHGRSSARRWCRRAGCDAGPGNTGYR